MSTVRIATRFQGPPTSGNGGYSGGLLAEALGGTVEVTLRAPPPLETPLRVAVEGDRASLHDGDRLIAEATRTELELAPPAAPSWAQAVDAARRYAGFHAHSFPACFACGPARAVGDGLRIFPGPATTPAVVASPWEPDDSLADAQGRIGLPVLWAALDCPGYWAFATQHFVPALLGRMAAHFVDEAQARRRYVIAGWMLGSEGRKHHAGTALFDTDGRCLGVARQTWIELRGA